MNSFLRYLRLTVKFFKFLRLSAKFLGVLRLSVNPIETLLKETSARGVMVTRSKYRTSYPTIVEDVKRILCSDKLPERVRLVCFDLGARPVCPAKDKKF